MLATLVPQPFHKPGWVYEEKYDGDRMLAYKEDKRVRLISRNGKDHTDRFRQLAMAIEKLRPALLLLDGEVVVLDRQGVSRFQLLQQGKGEPIYAIFDCLYDDGKDLRREPLSGRRQVLEQVVPPKDGLLLSHRLAENGLEAYEIAKRRGYEGLVAKDLSSPYVEKRSKFWLKVKVRKEDEFIIAGFTPPEGSRKYFGALLLGAYDKGKLRYVGKVGTGFDEPNSCDALQEIPAPHAKKIRARRSPAGEGRHISCPAAGSSDLLPGMDRRPQVAAACFSGLA